MDNSAKASSITSPPVPQSVPDNDAPTASNTEHTSQSTTDLLQEETTQPSSASVIEGTPEHDGNEENPDTHADPFWKEVPEDAVPVTADGQVLKVIMTEGTGSLPSLHARCLVHHTGRLLERGDVFLDTRSEFQSGQPVTLVAGRDCVSREAALNLAVSTMKLGEVARVYVLDPKYGYGERGSFSFPSVPPSAKLVYEMELLGWEPVGQGEQENLRTYEDKLEGAERRRMAGNDMFKEGKYKEALGKYAMALSLLDEEFMMQLEGFHLEKAENVKIPIHLNMAACQLRISDPTTAIYNCGQVLQMRPDSVKALFRRGCARHTLGQTEAALQDLERAAKLDPTDSGIQKEIRAVKQSIKEERKAEAKLFKGTLGPAPTPVAQIPATSTPTPTDPTPDSNAGGSGMPVVGSVVGAVTGAAKAVGGAVGWALGFGGKRQG